MPVNDTNNGISRELGEAIDDLYAALQQATEATSRVRSLVPRIGALGSLFDDIEAVLQNGRQQYTGGPSADAPSYTGPTLVPPPAPAPAPRASAPAFAPSAPQVQPAPSPLFDEPHGDAPRRAEASVATAPPPAAVAPAIDDDVFDIPGAARGQELTCFRLEFESRPGPLDLRTVDDAVSEHPAVRDVALLDYDGRRATLKVWITSAARPGDVQRALSERAAQIFVGNDITIVALEDVA